MAMQYNACRNEAGGGVGANPHECMSCYIL